ncbi:glycoside hydrolase family 3 C-terminal domain-containing protein [Aquihabitans sp. McL0605]|uniref:glycoside hydrolase family 3 C-terminal domain-containing protein n=1 Tax=Aquihabitans sp. McL0605 TaxID=3415671 RepID=UPI003CE6DEBD
MTASRFDVPALLDQLTLEEKASLVSGSGFWWTRKIERLGIPSIMVSDGPHGLRKQERSTDHVGIGGSVPATCFPTASALASSWDRDLVRRVGVAIGGEARGQDLAVVLGPGINLKRSPLCGRNFEYLSEDPVVAGELGLAMVDGIQSQGVGTSLKHYAVNNQEHDRLRVSADVDERPLRELYLAGFERVVRDGRPWTVMCSYNRINGVYASQDPWLLTEVLRGEWGFDGVVVSDWGAVDDPTRALPAGLDLEMPSTGGASARRIAAAVQAGDLDEAALDTAIERLLRLLDRTLPGVESDDAYDADAHHALAREAAADCVVLLENDGLLPLLLHQGRIAVIGEFARTPRFQGAGSSKVNPTRVDDALTALRAGVADGVTVDFAPGFGVDDPSADTAALRAEAVATATGADVAIVFLGLPPSFESEGYDRDHLDLPPEQVAVLEAVAAATERVVVVLANGSVVAIEGWRHHAGALVEGWLGGQAGGSAIADVLLGAVNPSGRLAETVPLRIQDTPSYLSFPGEDRHVRYGEGLHIGYRHYDARDLPVSYPFGHGLSYTEFDYADLTVEVHDHPGGSAASAGWTGAPRLAVRATITNTGPVRGKEVVQLYVADHEAAVTRPVRELKGFAKVALEPGESATVSFTLTERDLSYWSTRTGGWVLEPGMFEVAVGASSRDLRLTAAVAITGAPIAYPLDRSSTLGEWLEHPVGHEILLDALRRSPGGDMTGLTQDPAQVRMLGSFPMTRLATMLGPAVDGDIVDELLARLDG